MRKNVREIWGKVRSFDVGGWISITPCDSFNFLLMTHEVKTIKLTHCQ